LAESLMTEPLMTLARHLCQSGAGWRCGGAHDPQVPCNRECAGHRHGVSVRDQRDEKMFHVERPGEIR
jgi:hypothetical protein